MLHSINNAPESHPEQAPLTSITRSASDAMVTTNSNVCRPVEK